MKLDSKISMSDVSDGFSRPTGSQAKPAFANTLILGRQIQKGVSTSSPPSIVVTPLAEKERKGTGEEGAAKSSPQVTFESNGHSAGHRNRRQRLLLYGTVFTTVNTFCIQSISDFSDIQVSFQKMSARRHRSIKSTLSGSQSPNQQLFEVLQRNIQWIFQRGSEQCRRASPGLTSNL